MKHEGKPAIGDTVLYQTRTFPLVVEHSRVLPAIVVWVAANGETVELTVLGGGLPARTETYVDHAPGNRPTPGCWHWPPRPGASEAATPDPGWGG